MKKIFAGMSITIMMVACLVSCQDRLEEEYYDPEKTTNASIGGFFTKMLDNRRVRADYWSIRTILTVHSGVYTNSVSYTNAPKRFQQLQDYQNDLWKDYFSAGGEGIAGVVAHMREIEKLYNAMSAEEKAANEIFLQAAKTVYFDQTSQMVDYWGDIPFSEAGGLNLNGSLTPAKFDDAEEIYTQLIDGLEVAATYFREGTIDPVAQSSFAKQDLLLKGNVDKWERYINSIRLRLLMRISNYNEGFAKPKIQEILGDATKYPLVDLPTYNVLLDPLTNYNSNMRLAVQEVLAHYAPEYLLDGVLKPSNDPRIRALFDKGVSIDGPNPDYFAMPMDENTTSTEQDLGVSEGRYAVLDSSTFQLNTKFPGVVITSAEVNFLKAEAFERWGGGDAQAAYELGVTQAINFTFTLNQIGATFRGIDAEAAPTPTEINDALNSPTVAYTGTTEEKLQKIWLQKWVAFSFVQSNQAWAEYRRTNYPALEFVRDNGTVGAQTPPDRFLYPADEKLYNAVNYQAVKDKDNAFTPLFWDVD